MMQRKSQHSRRLQMSSGHSEGSWAVSYVDMLTLLLCFFIIFYSGGDKDKVKIDHVQKIMVELKGKALPAGTAVQGSAALGSGQVSSRAPASDSAQNVQPQVEKVFEVVKLDSKLKTQANLKNHALEINFEDISFFNTASTSLTPEGLEAVRHVIEMLKPYQNKVRVVVQGHTDSRNVVTNIKRASDNWELSVIRATSVLRLFKEEGFSQENLSAEGFANTRVGNGSNNRAVASEKDLSKQRRITLRVEEIEP